MMPELKGDRLLLRPPREQDKLDRLACGRNAKYIRMVGGDHRHLKPLTPEQVERCDHEHTGAGVLGTEAAELRNGR